MVEHPVTIAATGLQRDGQPWTAPGPWLGILSATGDDPRRRLLETVARARESALSLVALHPGDLDGERCLEVLADRATCPDMRGLLVDQSWQAALAARCDTLTGAAVDLGLADAARRRDDDRWQGHHLLAGATEAFLAQTWPDEVPPADRAVILGDGANALAVALAVARRGTSDLHLVVSEAVDREDLAARLGEVAGWSAPANVQLADRAPVDADPGGLWLRATAAPIADGLWLPDTAGRGPCVLLDVAGHTDETPRGFIQPDAGSIQVIAAGLAAAWYLGPPIPWDILRAAQEH